MLTQLADHGQIIGSQQVESIRMKAHFAAHFLTVFAKYIKLHNWGLC